MTPRIVVTVAVPALQPDPELARRRNARYADGIRRHGGEPVLLDASADGAERDRTLGSMDGLLLSGGADVHPSRYGQPIDGSREIERDRDGLELEAWAAAERRGLPVLGICRGFQAINVFSGGTLLQDVAGHAGPAYLTGPAAMHRIRVDPATRFGSLAGTGTLEVNTYHHQGVRPSDLAPSLVAAAWADGPAGELVEAVEAAGERFVIGVQCHPERTEFSPPELERLWAAFVDAARARTAAGAGSTG
jgi:putative glutamine amidotransferase